MSRELQTGSTGVAVEAVPEREVSCLSLELQAWLLQWAVALVLGLEILACPGSLEDLSREIGTAMEDLSRRSGSCCRWKISRVDPEAVEPVVVVVVVVFFAGAQRV